MPYGDFPIKGYFSISEPPVPNYNYVVMVGIEGVYYD